MTSQLLHNCAILFLLLLIAPAETLALHLSLGSTTLQFLEAFLRFGEFVCYHTLALVLPLNRLGDLPAALPYHLFASSKLFGHPIPTSVK